MSERTTKIIKELAINCLERNKSCPDYGGNGNKAIGMALNFFIGAANLAKIQADDELLQHLEKVILFCISIRGMDSVRELIKGE